MALILATAIFAGGNLAPDVHAQAKPQTGISSRRKEQGSRLRMPRRTAFRRALMWSWRRMLRAKANGAY